MHISITMCHIHRLLEERMVQSRQISLMVVTLAAAAAAGWTDSTPGVVWICHIVILSGQSSLDCLRHQVLQKAQTTLFDRMVNFASYLVKCSFVCSISAMTYPTHYTLYRDCMLPSIIKLYTLAEQRCSFLSQTNGINWDNRFWEMTWKYLETKLCVEQKCF